MKNFFFYLIALMSGLALLPSCEIIEAEGPVVTEFRNKTNFDGIKISICGQVNFQVAPQYKVEVQAPRNILDEMETKVENRALVIKWDNNVRIRDCEDVTVNLSGPDLKFIFNSGSSDIRVMGAVKHANLELVVSGSGSIDMDYAEIAQEIEAQVSGSGHVEIKDGKADENKLHTSGSGYIDMRHVPVKEADTHVSGSGMISVNVEDYLEAHISGSGDVYYYGDPRINSKVSGSGKVRRL